MTKACRSTIAKPHTALSPSLSQVMQTTIAELSEKYPEPFI
jgi:hypothetical protein